MSSLSYVATERRDDLENHCANIEAGQGRLLSRIDRNDDKISVRCKQTRKDVGIRNLQSAGNFVMPVGRWAYPDRPS